MRIEVSVESPEADALGVIMPENLSLSLDRRCGEVCDSLSSMIPESDGLCPAPAQSVASCGQGLPGSLRQSAPCCRERHSVSFFFSDPSVKISPIAALIV